MIIWNLSFPSSKNKNFTGLWHFLHKNGLLMRSRISSTRQEVSQTSEDSIFAPHHLSSSITFSNILHHSFKVHFSLVRFRPPPYQYSCCFDSHWTVLLLLYIGLWMERKGGPNAPEWKILHKHMSPNVTPTHPPTYLPTYLPYLLTYQPTTVIINDTKRCIKPRLSIYCK